MNNLDKAYTDLLKDILENGTRKGDRTGTGTISVFGRQIRHKMSEGFPLLTTKKMYMKGVITELLWFLRGETNIKSLVENDCHIWNGDAYKRYCNDKDTVGPLTMTQFIEEIKTNEAFSKKWGDLGPVYGKQWRNWGERRHDSISNEYFIGIDQIADAINKLKTDPDSRRNRVSAWNVGELDEMTLPPCHTDFQFYTRELSKEERIQIYVNQYMGGVGKPAGFEDAKLTTRNIPTRAISLMWNQRSVDTFLGLPFNIASYGLLLEIIAKVVNMVPDELIGTLGDVHLYSNHVEQALEQIGRELRVAERVCMCYENPSLDVSRLQQGMSDEEFTKVCDEFNIPTRTREPYPLPTLNIKLHFNNEPSFVPEQWLIDDFEIIGYKAHPTIKAPLSN